jgi:hypothetical protein
MGVDDFPPVESGDTTISGESPSTSRGGGKGSDRGEYPDTENWRSERYKRLCHNVIDLLRNRRPRAAPDDPVTVLYKRGMGWRDDTDNRG